MPTTASVVIPRFEPGTHPDSLAKRRAMVKQTTVAKKPASAPTQAKAKVVKKRAWAGGPFFAPTETEVETEAETETLLEGTQLEGPQLEGTQLEGTELENAQLPDTQPPDAQPPFEGGEPLEDDRESEKRKKSEKRNKELLEVASSSDNEEKRDWQKYKRRKSAPQPEDEEASP